MAEVEAEIEETELENEDGRMQPAVQATCSDCGHVTQSFGTSDASRKRCLVMLREECPLNKRNFYVEG